MCFVFLCRGALLFLSKVRFRWLSRCVFSWSCSPYTIYITNIPKSFIRLIELVTLVILQYKSIVWDGIKLKTLRITDDVHEKLTGLLGELTAETLKMQTYTDAIKSLLEQSVIIPPELLTKVEDFIKERDLGFTSREEFFREAARRTLKLYDENFEFIQVRRQMYEKAKTAIDDLDLPFMGVDDLIEEQLKKLLEQHDQWIEQKEEAEKSE